MLKKNFLLIFGLLGLVSLMAESGPKKSNLLTMLGLDSDSACCDVTVCCQGADTSCCDLSTCCTSPSNCCAPATSCCTSDATDQSNTTATDGKVSHCSTQCK